MKNTIWKNKRFFFYASGNAINNLGNNIFMVAMPLFVYDITQSAISMSIMGVVEFIPQILLSVIIGAFVDRLSRRTIIFVSLGFQSFCYMVLIFFIGQETASVGVIYIIGFLLSIGQSFFRTAQFAVIPAMFKERKAEAMAAISNIYTLTTLIGPITAGILLTTLGYGYLFLLSSLTSIFPIVFCIWSKLPHLKQESFRTVIELLNYSKEGLIFIRGSKRLMLMPLIIGGAILADGGSMAIILFHIKNNLHLSDAFASWMLIASGVGAFLVTMFPKKYDSVDKGRNLFIFILICSIGNSIFLFPYVWTVPFAMFISTMGRRAFIVTFNVIIQEIVPDNLLGRISGTIRSIYTISYPISFLILGFVTELFGTTAAFATIVCMSLIPTSIIRFSSIYKYKTQ